MKRIAKSISESRTAGSIFGFLFLNRAIVSHFNMLYEYSPWYVREVFVRLCRQPLHDFDWVIVLPNGRRIKVEVKADDPRSFEFALSYKWHDRNLRLVETILNDRIEKSRILVDVGANLGLRSVYSLAIGRKCLLFEPNPYLRPFTENLFKMNSLDNYLLENACVSDLPGTAKFYISPSGYLSSLSREHALSDTYGSGVKEIVVNVVSLDRYFSDAGISDPPGIIKIDTEGHEYFVVKGAKSLITKYKPVLMVEATTEGLERELLFESIREFGYTCYGISKYRREPRLIVVKNTRDFDNQFLTENFVFTADPSLLDGIKCI